MPKKPHSKPEPEPPVDPSTPEPEAEASEQAVQEAAEAAPPSKPAKHASKKRDDGEVEELREQLLRTMAEFQNFRKRVQQEKSQIQQYAIELLVLDLLPVLDNFERTNQAMRKGAGIESIQSGLDAVERQLRKALEDRSLTRIPSKGAPFDPEVHEAVVTEDSLWHPDGTVLEELEPGYRLRDRVIRPARVKVSRKP